MARYLLTHSLVNSWVYLMDCYEAAYDNAYEDFIKTLNREPKEPTEAMMNGREFEDLVYQIADGRPHPKLENHKWYAGASELAKFIANAPDQIPLYGNTKIHGMDILVYGILDSLKAGVIYDVKFSNKSFGSADIVGKYLNSPQHPTYFFLCPEATDFVYLISDGEDIYTERYTRKMTRDFHEVAEEFFSFLETANLLETYKEKWDTEKCNWHGRDEMI